MEIGIKDFLLLLFFVLLFLVSDFNGVQGIENTDSQDLLSIDPNDRLMVLVSSLDGSVTALDGRTGVFEWELDAGSKPLLLSSISDIQMTRNGLPSRLIPSLDGGLYQLDGEGVETIPLTADLLLTSTFKLTDENSIVGGKEIETYGVDVNNGKVRYVCSSDKCSQTSDLEGQSDKSNEVLIIKRTDRTIRLVDIMEGQEKWNFSVGQLEMSYHMKSDPLNSIEGEEHGDVAANRYHNQEEVYPRFSFSNLPDVVFKIHMPNKLLVAVDRGDPVRVVWEHQFDSSIAGAWMLRGRELSSIELFDDQSFTNHLRPGMMYIGLYNDMLYIQPLDTILKDQVALINEEEDDEEEEEEDDSTQMQVYMPRVKWKPYIATATSRTPIILAEKAQNVGLKAEPAKIHSIQRDKSLALLNKNQYPFDSGYFLYPDNTPIENFGSCQNVTTMKGSKRETLVDAISKKWKEVSFFLFVSLTSLLTYLKKRFSKASKQTKVASPPEVMPQLVSKSCSAQHDLVTNDDLEIRRESSREEVAIDTSQQFISRYSSDFEQQECLGRGGFGVVFKAYNKIDECSYAVKRIALKDSKTAREKVMREVKALAKLDHPGIVRYYQSWLECPPPGWQEKHDALVYHSGSLGTEPSLMSNATSEVQSSKREVSSFKNPKLMNDTTSDSIIFADDVKVKIDTDDVALTMESSWGGDSTEEEKEDSVETKNDDGFGDRSTSDSVVFEGSEPFCMIWNHDSLRRRNVPSLSSGLSVQFLESSNRPPAKEISRGVGRLSIQRDDSWVVECSPSLKSDPKQQKDDPPRKLYLYIQMQLCRPESLKEWLDVQPFESDVTYDIFYQIVSAISYVHVQGLMHRDLKPSNIFFAMDGTIKIGDFGLVTDVENICDNNEGEVHNNKDKKHTNQVGTQLYMSPELSSGQNYTHKVDIYALGVIFFEMFQRFSTGMERARHLQQLRQLKFPESFMRDFKDEHEFIKPLLSHDPTLRPEACDLLKLKLLSDYEESSNLFRRLHRTRTLSMQSNSSFPGVSSSH